MPKGWLTALPLALVILTSCSSDDVETPPETIGQTVPDGQRTAVINTTMGTIVIALDTGKSPTSVANFIQYAQDGSYDGTIFHRVISGFMIQGGGFDEHMAKRVTRAAVQNESDNGVPNSRGTVAMARTQDPHSATNQFFINLVDNTFLDHGAQGANSWGYAVFARVVEGMDVVDKIQALSTTQVGTYSDVPETPIIINSIQVNSSEEES